MKINCFTCKYGYEDERLGIPMCHHPKRFSEDCVNFNMYEEKETEESEKPMQEGLEEEIKKEMANLPFFLRGKDQIAFARHFAEWGYLQAAEKYNEIEYNRQRAEESVQKDLEEAARKSAIAPFNLDVDKEHLDEYPYLPIAEQKFIEGAKWQKEQMMKEAVEGKIIFLLNGDVAVNIGDTDKYNLGQKVRVIIVKED